MNAPQALTRRVRRRRERARRFFGVAGEASLTLGLITGMFIVWQFVFNDPLSAREQTQEAISTAQLWSRSLEKVDPSQEPQTLEEPAVVLPSSDDPPVLSAQSAGQVFALLYVPRFGRDYVRPIGEGVDLSEVLNNPRIGVGRYTQSAELGAMGNFALAGHRTTFGAPFSRIAELRLGDSLYVEVDEGWFAYSFRNLEYVWPSEVDVLNPVPQQDIEVSPHRLLTLTSCHPKLSEAERVIAYSVFVGWYPRENGPPSELAHHLQMEP